MPTQLILNPFRLTARAGGGQTAWEPGRVGPGSGTQWRAPPLEAVCSGQGISLPTPSSKSYLDTQIGDTDAGITRPYSLTAYFLVKTRGLN